MNRSEKIEYFLKNPLSVIREGVLLQTEPNHHATIKSKYGIEALPSIDILDLFPQLDENLNYYSFLTGTSMITDMVLLKSLARKFKDCSYLEIGSWRGESIANVADVAKECISITLGPEELRSMNISEDFIRVHGIFSKDKKNITTIEANTHSYDFEKLSKKFDLIFVDGDHSYEGVLNDTQKVLPLRKNNKSIIVWHDYSNNPEEIRPSVLQGILDGIPAEKHKNLYHVSNTLCAIYLEEESFSTNITKFPTYPNKNFSIHVKATPL